MKIRVFTDLRFVATTTPTGVGKHVYHMARGLADTPGCEASLLAASDQVQNPGVLDFLPIRRMPLPWQAVSVLWTVASRPHADRWCGDADWIYCPKNDWIPLRTKRLAITIHGAHELDPAMPPPASPMQWLYRLRNRVQYMKMCRHADVVFTVSEFLRARICEWFGADPDKVVVVGNGVEPEYFAAGQKRAPVDASPASPSLQPLPSSLLPSASPYVLAVGGLNHLDGGDRIVAVANEIVRRGLGVRIRVAGRLHEQALEGAARAHPRLELLGYVPAQRLAPLMAGAVALLYPTRYETFGMGAAEAMASGTPVITCRSTAVPEIVGDAGIYVDPDKVGETVEAIQSLLGNPEKGAAYAERGRRRATQYTWAACVQRVWQQLVMRSEGRGSGTLRRSN